MTRPGDWKQRRGLNHRTAAAVFGSEGRREPVERSSRGSFTVSGPPALQLGPRDVAVTLIRGDGLTVTRVVDGAELDRSRYPGLAMEAVTRKAVTDFVDGGGYDSE